MHATPSPLYTVRKWLPLSYQIFMSCKNYRSMHAYTTPTGIYNAEMMTTRLPNL